MDITSKKILILNGNWQAINIRTVKDVFVSMMGGDENNPPVCGLDLTYNLDKNGEPDFKKMPSIVPVSWVEWMALPIREYDSVINTSKYKIRVPTVAVAVNYKKVPKKKSYPTLATLMKMQKNICGYTGLPMSKSEASLEHVIPKSHGGKDTFENLMAVKKKVNHERGNKPLSEVGLKPLFRHTQPKEIPVSFTFKEGLHRDWVWFLGQ